MASCIDRLLAAAALAFGCAGCVTGHLFAMGTRHERAVGFDEGALHDERLRLAYRAQVTDAAGIVVGQRTRRAEVDLTSLAPNRPMDTVAVRRLPDDRPLGGTPLAIRVEAPGSVEFAPAAGPPLLLHVWPSATPDEPPLLEVRRADGTAAPPLWANVLARRTTAPWVYPLVPVAVVIDATSLPVLLFFAPGAIVIGD